jgi:hypothetical protein
LSSDDRPLPCRQTPPRDVQRQYQRHRVAPVERFAARLDAGDLASLQSIAAIDQNRIAIRVTTIMAVPDDALSNKQ